MWVLLKGGLRIEAHFKGEIQLRHFIQAQLLHLTLARWVSGGVVVTLLFVMGIYMAIDPFDLEDVLPILLTFLILTASPHWFPYVQTSLQRRRILPSLRPLAGRVDSDGVYIHTGFSKPVFLWTEYSRFRMSKQLVLLYLAAGGIQIYPREFFDNYVQWRDFRGLVQTYVQRGG